MSTISHKAFSAYNFTKELSVEKIVLTSVTPFSPLVYWLLLKAPLGERERNVKPVSVSMGGEKKLNELVLTHQMNAALYARTIKVSPRARLMTKKWLEEMKVKLFFPSSLSSSFLIYFSLTIKEKLLLL
jgi:hypothetical protein